MNKIIIIVVVFLALIHISFAFTVSIPEGTIKVKTNAETQIPIEITGNVNDALTATIINAKPWTSLNESHFTMNVAKKTINLAVTPYSDVILGNYVVPITFKSLITGEEKNAALFINVEKGEVLNVERILIIGSLEPLGSATIQVFVKSFKSTSVDGATIFVRVTSQNQILNEFTRSLPRLDPDQSISADFNIFFGKNAPAGTYEVYANVRYINETPEYRQTFALKQISVIQKETSKSPTIFGFEKRIKLTNNGNIAGEEVITDYLSSIESAFFSGDSPTLKSSGVYTWVVRNIQPGETRYIVYRIDYSPLFLFIVALIIAGWVMLFKLKTIRIKKHIVQKKRIEAGEEFTMAIEVSNKLGGRQDVIISDFVPAVFDVRDAEGPKPVKKKSHAGTELSWHVKDIHLNEARIMMYKIVPVFGVHGTLKLPKASVEYKFRNMKLRNSSNSPAIGLSAEGAEESILKLKRKK